MAISLGSKNLKRYKNIAWLLFKYGRGDLVRSGGLESLLDEKMEESGQEPDEKAAQLADDLEALGPSFVKIGQMLSTRPDILPAAYRDSLERLQDKVKPFSFQQVEEIVTSELGVRLSKAFEDFNSVPIAAASLGQVHEALLKDGRRVAVKVQRPGIREEALLDLDAFEQIAIQLEKHTETGRTYQLIRLVEEFRTTLLNELDYEKEADNLSLIGKNLKDFDRIIVPKPIRDFTTSRVLTMDYLQGKKVTSIGPLGQLELEGKELAEQLFRAYLQQILIDGFFHADPHPGNVFLTDNQQIALLDLGMVARFAPGTQEDLTRLLLAVSEGRGEEAADRALKVGSVVDGFDETSFRRDVARLVSEFQNRQLKQIAVGRVILQISQICTNCGLRIPTELAMLGKTLLNLDQVGNILDPSFEPNEAIRNYAAEIMKQRMRESVSLSNAFAGLMETKEFVEHLPGRLNKIMGLVADNKLSVNIDAIDEQDLITGLQKIANRITMGIVLASLILGAALLMQVQTSFRILGYPGLAILLFLAAAAGGMALLVNILISDRKRPGKPKQTP